MGFRTDRQRVEGLGSAKEGVGHWWTHRLTSVALVPLTLLFIFPFARALGGGYEEVRAVYEHRGTRWSRSSSSAWRCIITCRGCRW